MDGYPIEVGDAVFDTAFGPGRVTFLADNGGSTVSFGKMTVAYDMNGRTRRFSRRTLFWKNPIIAAPPKADARWSIVRAMAAAAVNVVTQNNIEDEDV
jgi:hypothetical protein